VWSVYLKIVQKGAYMADQQAGEKKKRDDEKNNFSGALYLLNRYNAFQKLCLIFISVYVCIQRTILSIEIISLKR
jgi:hypothetical protein